MAEETVTTIERHSLFDCSKRSSFKNEQGELVSGANHGLESRRRH